MGAILRSLEATGTEGGNLSRKGTYCYFEEIGVENGM